MTKTKKNNVIKVITTLDNMQHKSNDTIKMKIKKTHVLSHGSLVPNVI